MARFGSQDHAAGTSALPSASGIPVSMSGDVEHRLIDVLGLSGLGIIAIAGLLRTAVTLGVALRHRGSDPEKPVKFGASERGEHASKEIGGFGLPPTVTGAGRLGVSFRVVGMGSDRMNMCHGLRP